MIIILFSLKREVNEMRNIQGMTLLEVIVALVMFSIAGLTIMKTIGEELYWLSKLDDRIFSSWIAENILTEIQLNNYLPKYSWTNGSIHMINQLWYWRWRGEDSINKELVLLTVEVRKNIDTSEPDFILKGYMIRP